ncbi:uncharacterized protein LOC122029965 isoform X2 [Zingiber officinale]|uniref:uncharacterized protein LOC122029965 isoform X2 n=1 Tax=Zingiber officinale TaxID=94328 RepID=UPI001C4BE906|nr:uncharacterized protein LOC122029965 isoform X2 [Zingiber officinale]
MAFFSIPRPISPSPPLLLTKCRPFFKSQITRVPASPTLLRHRIPPPPAASPELEAVEEDEKFPTPLLEEESDVAASVEVLKAAAKTRKAPPAQVLAALASIKKGKAEPSSFLETLGGTESPGRTWMLIFTAQGKLDKGRYFPITAVQRFDAAAKRIENGVFLGPVGSLTFEGKFSWKNRILAFIFQTIRIKLGPFGPLQIDLGETEREPTSKDPFFIWFYIDEEIAVAQGRGGGIAYWCRCHRVT